MVAGSALAPLAAHDYFARVRADPEVGTIVWSNGVGLDPDVLYALVANEALPSFEPAAPVTSMPCKHRLTN